MLSLCLKSQSSFVNHSSEEAVISVTMLILINLFLFQIYEVQPDISNSFKTSEFIPLPRLLSMVMVTTVPAVCNKIMFTQGLNVRAVYISVNFYVLINTV